MDHHLPNIGTKAHNRLPSIDALTQTLFDGVTRRRAPSKMQVMQSGLLQFSGETAENFSPGPSLVGPSAKPK